VLVLDASAAVDLLLRTPRGDRVAAALGDDPVVAPELIDVEVLSALARLLRAGELAAPTAGLAVEQLRSMPVRRLSHALVVPAVWRLREWVRIADAWYVAFAQALSAPLLTTDARLARAALPELSVLVVR
jgi:predicted nucleic acid-binding protein